MLSKSWICCRSVSFESDVSSASSNSACSTRSSSRDLVISSTFKSSSSPSVCTTCLHCNIMWVAESPVYQSWNSRASRHESTQHAHKQQASSLILRCVKRYSTWCSLTDESNCAHSHCVATPCAVTHQRASSPSSSLAGTHLVTQPLNCLVPNCRITFSPIHS